jgi:predicted protein tyrosine phosphatase
MPHRSLELILSTSRAGAETFRSVQPYAVVSITDPQSRPALLRQSNIVARCDLQFWDLLADVGTGRIFDAALANEVLRFARYECDRAKLLLVHCEAGISRSTGMADALGRILGVEVRHHNALTLNPNTLVMRLILEAAGLTLDPSHTAAFSEYRASLEQRLREFP